MFESGIESRLPGLTNKKQKQKRERQKESEMLTHISIKMQCQWSVCEVSCCLVTVLQQQRQYLCLNVSPSQWWVSARFSCCRHVCCLETMMPITRILPTTVSSHPQKVLRFSAFEQLDCNLPQTVDTVEERSVPT